MRLAPALYFRSRLPALPTTTMAQGTAVLWSFSSWLTSSWLCIIGPRVSLDSEGLILRHHRKVLWPSISRIGVARSYLDGHVSEMRIHHKGGVTKISMRGLPDGEELVRAIVTMLQRTTRGPAIEGSTLIEPLTDHAWLGGLSKPIDSRPRIPTELKHSRAMFS